MRNSISAALVIVAIIVAVGATFAGGISQVHAAGGFHAANGGFGMLIALLLGLVGIALKPNTTSSAIKAELADEQLTAKFVFAARNAMWEQSTPVVNVEADFFDGYVPVVNVEATSAGVSFDGIEAEAFILELPMVTSRVRLIDTQIKVLRTELNRKDLSSNELFSLGVALMQAKKGLLA